MLSTISILGIFTEIFCAGILISGAVTFFARCLKLKQIKDLWLALILAVFSFTTILALVSQISFNLGSPFSNLILVHKVIAISNLAGSILLGLFILNKLDAHKYWYALLAPASLLSGFFIFQTIFSQVNLIFRQDIIEPIVTFSPPVPATSIWVFMWLLLGLSMLVKAFFSPAEKRVLKLFLSISSLLLFSASLCIMAYTATGLGLFLLVSWLATLVGVLGLLLAEIIPFDSPLALTPLKFFRTRLLFKLILIFVLLIVILFEVTTLATLTLSKDALSRSILNTYFEIARGTAQKISANPNLSSEKLFELVASEKIGRSGLLYLVDSQGRILAHPDPARIGENISQLYPVKELMQKRSGRADFTDELGYRMVGAYYPVFGGPGGGVITQETIEDAYFEMRQLETNSILFMIAGILITIITGVFFAESIEKPVHHLIEGTEAVSKGDLNYNIKTESLDEIGSLAQAFNRMTHNLKESQDRLVLSEKMASLGTMAAGMAHEIKNPLVALRTFSQLLPQKWMDPEYREKFSAIVPAEIERINKIAESLLKFGRPVKVELSKVNINNVLEEILLLNESECKKNGVRITIKLAQVPEIVGDPSQLSQALLNLILNAIQSMPNGGELIIKTDTGEVTKLGPMGKGVQKAAGEIVWGEEGEEKTQPIPVVFVEISDTGSGIAAENLKNLFDPFFTTKDKGTGMGLPITLKIIEEHKGSIKVKSQIEIGTSFLVTLPLKREAV